MQGKTRRDASDAEHNNIVHQLLEEEDDGSIISEDLPSFKPFDIDTLGGSYLENVHGESCTKCW